MMDQTDILTYYAQHSALTDPGAYAHLLDDLPTDISSLAAIVQGLLIVPFAARLYGIQPADINHNVEFGIRPMAQMLERLYQIAARPFTSARPARQRLGANCRNFGVLLVTMLRRQGIPARLRVGFAGPYGGSLSYDHRITEYWHAKQGRWVLVDAMLDEPRRKALNIHFDPNDITPSDQFSLAGDVWRRCRAGQADPDAFGDSETDRGMAPIRYALLHDFDALNKVELLGCDAWGPLIAKPEQTLTAEDLAFLDHVATLTSHVDDHFSEMRMLYESSPHGCAVRDELQKLGLE